MNRSQAVLLIILSVVTISIFIIILPFIEYILLAMILAYVLHPVERRLRPYTGSFLSPILIIFGSLIVIVIPIVYLVARIARDLEAIARGESEIETEVIEAQISELLGVEIDIVGILELGGQVLIDILFGSSTAIIGMVIHTAIGIALLLFLVFYILRDGEVFIVWLQETTPLPRTVSQKLIDQIDRTVWGAVIGHGFAAFVQTIVAGIGLYLVGIPNVFFWTFVMFILAFLPLIGVFLVWGPASIYLYVIGSTVEGMLLAIYGLTIVSMIDYYARPLVIDRRARLNPAVILVGVFGGLFTIGFIGIFIGPILIGIFVATLQTIRYDYDKLHKGRSRNI